uniref:Lipocalin/cytosolic fatty-acid binding domain-containing protein n=1 Tax=Neogobius melanostomus TaxID=47308 RepID=A0A8C6WJ73_9GOBI
MSYWSLVNLWSLSFHHTGQFHSRTSECVCNIELNISFSFGLTLSPLQFLGRWFEVAVASTCPHFMQRKMRNSAIVVLDLQHSAPVGNITVTATSLRNVSCKTTSTNYSLTETPGRFFYHVPKFDADVDVFVADTNYVEYALMVLVSTERSAGNETLIVKLYSRSRDASETIKENFKTLVRRQGINDKAIIFNWDRGHCEQLTTDTAHT